MTTKKILYDIEKLTPAQRRAHEILLQRAETSTEDGGSSMVDDASGLMNTQPIEPTHGFLRAPVETVLQGQVEGGAQIVIGRDRPGDIITGYGGLGAMSANSIDLVVGRGSSMNSGNGPTHGTAVNPNFVTDAARIHISQMTDIDINFGLSPGMERIPARRSIGKSGIGIKADGVRIVGREGVKIITGPTYSFGPAEPNSWGNSIEGMNPKIELIAGNYAGTNPGTVGNTLQGITKGKNLESCLLTLIDHINKIIDRIVQFAMLQNAMNSAVGANIWHPQYASMATFTFTQVSDTIIAPLQALRSELTNYFPAEYLEDGSDKYITSTKVFAT